MAAQAQRPLPALRLIRPAVDLSSGSQDFGGCDGDHPWWGGDMVDYT